MLTKEKYEQLTIDFEKWWSHELKRPIIQVTLNPKTPLPYSRGEQLCMCYDPNVDVRDVAKAYEENFNHTIYMGDAFPVFYERATGILGGFIGQDWEVSKENATVWFKEMGLPLKDIHPYLDRDFWFYQRALDLIDAFTEHFGDTCAYGIPDLGGMMDIVESMRGANNSLMDLYDDPDEVIRLRDDIYEANATIMADMMAALKDKTKLGYSGWITMLSQRPYFIAQCDFCCMISPAAFDQFVKPTLVKESQLVDRSFYHLDGPGAVRHLDKILECGFDGIQWIQGAGAAGLDSGQWDAIYHKVRGAGKLLQLFINNADELPYIDYVVDQLGGDTSGLAFICYGTEDDIPAYTEYLKKYNVPL